MPEMLLLCNRPARGSNADTIIEHLDALREIPGWSVRELSILGDIPKALDLNRFDAIGIHYTLHISDPNNHWLSRAAMDRIAQFNGLKCIWMHDEYRRVDEVASKLRHMGIGTIFTVIPEPVAKQVYSADRIGTASVHTILAGYVSPALARITAPPFASRTVAIGYRARRPPFWLGRLGQEKIEIGLKIKALAQSRDIPVDISVEEADRIYGDAWLDFLKNAKATLCVESGSSVVDFTGQVEEAVENAVRDNPALRFDDFVDLLQDVDGRLMINCISPRIFEMAACRTLVIAHTGEYSGLIKPWVHYVPLEKDNSNFDQLVAILHDEARCRAIIDQAYEDLIASANFSYDQMSRFCAANLPVPDREKRPLSGFAWFAQRHASFSFLMHNYVAQGLQKWVLSSRLRSLLIRLWLALPAGVQDILRPLLKVLGR